MSENDKISKALNKKKMYILETENNKICVLFREKGKHKLAWIKKNYLHRQGVKTFATVKPGSRIPWSVENDTTEKYLTRLLEFDTSGLDEFDISMLDSITW